MKVFLIWGYSNAVVYGQPNSNKDLLEIHANEEKAKARLKHLEETVGKKYNVYYTITDGEVIE